jgi:hypothetical protein
VANQFDKFYKSQKNVLKKFKSDKKIWWFTTHNTSFIGLFGEPQRVPAVGSKENHSNLKE